MGRALQECGGGNRKEAHDLRIREPIATRPYALTSGGYKKKYEEEHTKMAQAYNEMHPPHWGNRHSTADGVSTYERRRSR